MTEEEKQSKLRVTNIQRFCVHDGPGIRTTVFLKGCSLHCPWCANPETIRYEIQPYYNDKGQIIGEYGYDISLKDLERELLKDRAYYEDGGGITFSGGEPLLHIGEYLPLLKQLKQEKINLAVETSLFVPSEAVRLAVNYFDIFYVDMKILEPEKCKSVLGGKAEIYCSNLNFVCSSTDNVFVRIPCCSFTASEENLDLIVKEIKMNQINKVEVFNLHGLAEEKYKKLNRSKFVPEKEDYANFVRSSLEGNGITCVVNQVD